MSPRSVFKPSPEPQATEEEFISTTSRLLRKEELCTLDLEDADSLLEHVQDLISQHLDEFPDDGVDDDEVARYAAKMAKANYRWYSHWTLAHYFVFHLRRNKKWDAKRVDEQTPRDIAAFITQNVARRSKGSKEERSVQLICVQYQLNNFALQYSTAVSTRQLLLCGTAVSVPTKVRQSGDLIQPQHMRAGIVRYVAYLLAWLMMLRIDEVVHLTFENIDKIVARTASVLGRSLSKDLQELGYASWALYGTHSFRRGGCQYRIKVKKWSAGEVAAWGGWSQVEAVTMFRYFYSPNDNHEFMQDYDKNY
ncbi:hypothetical protein B0H14DRAFT_2595937 [Mycena olivaceomarginata]|nr:hypothetical protein B0H14DRAFT_2595937 [Mycena olivaceomarginata]